MADLRPAGRLPLLVLGMLSLLGGVLVTLTLLGCVLRGRQDNPAAR